MLTKKSIWILLIVTVLAVGAVVISRQAEQNTSQTEGGLYFPGLLAQSNEVIKVTVKDAQATTTIERKDGQWAIEEKGGYPAATAKIRELILGLARLKQLEPKTSNPELYAKLDLNDVAEPGSKSKLLQLKDDSEQSLAVLFLGKRKNSGTGREQIYVRSPDDAQTWLVEGFLPVIGGADGWMETTLIGPEEIGDVRSVTIVRGDDTLVVARQDRDVVDFHVQGLGSEDEIQEQYKVNQVAQGFKGLRMEDVRPASALSGGAVDAEAILQSFDGMNVSLELWQQDDQQLARLKAIYEPGEEDSEELRTRAQTWNDLWRRWVFVLPSYQVESIFVTREDLLQQEDAAPQGQQ